MRILPSATLAALIAAGLATVARAEERPRIRDLGIAPGILSPGPLNAITDVGGVRVGHNTVIEGEAVRTGVTAILPHSGNLFQDKVEAAVFVANAFGKAAGFLQVQELGTIETPIVLTNTLAVGAALEATVAWTLAQPGNEAVRSVNAVVGETNDGYLNDIRGQHIRPEHVLAAIAAASDGTVAEGSVGAGTGTRALGWKGGIGTSSRWLPASLGGYTVGALVQSNFGGVLTVDGVRVGEALGRFAFREQLTAPASTLDSGASPTDFGASPTDPDDRPPAGAGSCMIVLATDAPLSARSLERLASRALLGLGRAGSFIGHGSGDFVIAFSTTRRAGVAGADGSREVAALVDGDSLDPLFLAAIESVEEAVYNSLLRATTVRGRDGHIADAISIEALERLLARR